MVDVTNEFRTVRNFKKIVDEHLTYYDAKGYITVVMPQSMIAKAVQFPSIRELLGHTDKDLTVYIEALRCLITNVYGNRHLALTARQRQHRATLNKLSNLLEQIDLLDDAMPYELGYACPGQVKQYSQSLQESVHHAYHNGIDKDTLRLVEEIHERNWQVMQEVTLLFDGLS